MSISLDQAVNYRSKYTVKIDSRATSAQKSGGYSRRKNVSRQIVNIFLVFSVIVMSFFGFNANSTKEAQAFVPSMEDFCEGLSKDGVWFNYPETVFMGPSIPEDFDRKNNKITAYEKFGTSGTNWTVYRGPINGDKASERYKDGTAAEYDDENAYFANGECFPSAQVFSAAASNAIFSLTKVTVFVSGFVYETAFESSSTAIQQMQEQIGLVITPENGTRGLKDTLYLDFLVPVIMISALYLGWVGMVKRKQSEALSAGLWMMGSAITGLLLLLNPMFIPNAANGLVNGVTDAVMTGITESAVSNTQNVGSTSEVTSNLCSVPEASTNDADQKRRISRVTQCVLWYSFVYTPWASGQYGYTPGDPAGEAVFTQNHALRSDVSLGSEPAQPLTWPIYQVDAQTFSHNDGVNWDGKADAWQNIPMGQLGEGSAGNDTVVNTVWKGDSSFGLISKALFSLIAAGGAGFMIITLGMSMIVFEIGLIVLMMMAPLFLLIGVHPGFGRRVALRWLETIISITLKRIVLSVLLGVMITFYSIVIAIPQSDLPWIGSVIMIIAISIAGIKYKDTLTDMFANVNLGGGGPMKYEGGDSRNMAKGAAAGLVGSAVGLALAGKATKAGGGGGVPSTMGKKGSGAAPSAAGGGTTQRAKPSFDDGAPAVAGSGAPKPIGPAGGDDSPAGKDGAEGTNGSGAAGRVGPEFSNEGSETSNNGASGDVVSNDLEDNGSGNASGSSPRNAPDFDEDGNAVNGSNGDDTETKVIPVETRTGLPLNGDTGVDTGEEGNASSAGAHNSPEFDEDGNEVAAVPVSRRQQRILDNAETKSQRLQDRMDKNLARRSKKARSRARLVAIGTATVGGAMQGKHGMSAFSIAQDSTGMVRKATSRANSKTTGVNEFSAIAHKRQEKYVSAWKEYNNATTDEGKKVAAEKIDKIYKSMSKSEIRYLKGNNKVAKKVAKVQQKAPGATPKPAPSTGSGSGQTTQAKPNGRTAPTKPKRGTVDPTNFNIPQRPSKP